MDVHEALLSRRTVFRYRDQAVPDDVLQRALEAARWAPNHRLTEPWRFYVAGAKTRTALGEAAEIVARQKARDADPADLPAIIDKQRRKITDLPGLVVVAQVKNPDDAFMEKEDYAAVSCAIHNLVLSLWADGVGAQWSTGGVTRHAKTYEILGIDAKALEIVGFIKIGFPDEVPTSKRRPLDEVTEHLP